MKKNYVSLLLNIVKIETMDMVRTSVETNTGEDVDVSWGAIFGGKE